MANRKTYNLIKNLTFYMFISLSLSYQNKFSLIKTKFSPYVHIITEIKMFRINKLQKLAIKIN